MNGFTIELPEGFVRLPVTSGDAGGVDAALGELFGLPATDESVTQVARGLSALGLVAGGSGAEFAALGLFRSPEDPTRPVGVLLTASRMPSDHDQPATAIAGLRHAYAADPDIDTEVLTLAAGPALTAFREEPAIVEAPGIDPLPLLQRQVVAWVPDPVGSAVAVLGVSSNSWRDWAHVREIARDVFDSLVWEDGGQVVIR